MTVLFLIFSNNVSSAQDSSDPLMVNGLKLGLPVLLIELDSGKILKANSAAKNFYGYPSLTSKTIQQINTFSAQQVAQERQRSAKEGRNYFIFSHQLADGSIKKVEVFSYSTVYQDKKALLSLILPIERLQLPQQALAHYQTKLEKSLVDQAVEIEKSRQLSFALMTIALIILSFLVLYLWRTLKRTQSLQSRLFQTQSQLKATLDALPALLFEIDEQGIFINFHSAKHDKLHIPPEQFLGKNFNDCLPPNVVKITSENILSLEQTGTLKHQQYSLEIDGKLEYFELSASVKKSSNFAKSYIFLSHTITERIHAEESLKRYEENFRLISENISEVLWLRDVESNKIIYISPVYESLWGQSTQDLYADNLRFLDPIVEEDKPQVWSSYQQMPEKGWFENTYRIIGADKKIHWIHAKGNVVKDKRSESLFEVGRATDITELKEKESQLELAASVFKSAREAIVITQPDSTIIDVNQAFTEITGYPRGEVVGKKINILKSQKHSPSFYENLWNCVQQDGVWSGEMWNKKRNGEIYPQSTTISTVFDPIHQMPVHLVMLFSDISEQKAHQKQLEYLANFDDLTRLPNRRLLSDRLIQAMMKSKRGKDLLAIAFIDLDGFKAFNDQYGHSKGDQLLIQISAKMTEVLRKSDTLSRLGGDEFVVIFENLQTKKEVIPLLERLLNAVKSHECNDNHHIALSASIGVTIYPDDQVDAEQLIRHADQAMYQAKRLGKDQYSFFDIEKELAMQSNQDWLNVIESALSKQEFTLYYQPQVNMNSGEIIGFEALIRWQHPDKGLIFPDNFLPFISGWPIEVSIDYWVIQKALDQLLIWHKNQLFNTKISVNVSGQLLLNKAFIDRLKQILKAYPQEVYRRLEIEVLESSALADLNKVSEAITLCQKIGIHFALDDFGTGYSSLTYLRYLPANLIKIDQSFIREMITNEEDKAIVEGIIGLASAFDRKVIAEGVETYEHAQILLEMGCELGQGYGIAKPMPIEQLDDWVQQWQQNGAWLAAQSNQIKS